jgi:hypothetical protein
MDWDFRRPHLPQINTVKIPGQDLVLPSAELKPNSRNGFTQLAAEGALVTYKQQFCKLLCGPNSNRLDISRPDM